MLEPRLSRAETCDLCFGIIYSMGDHARIVVGSDLPNAILIRFHCHDVLGRSVQFAYGTTRLAETTRQRTNHGDVVALHCLPFDCMEIASTRRRTHQ